MKSILMSIKPKWVEKIASGEKTVEVRKTAPKLEVPFKCYIYETKAQYVTYQKGAVTKYGYGKGKVIGEFVCDEILPVEVLDTGAVRNYHYYHLEETNLSIDDIAKYIGKNKVGYGWHISDLKIYDKPKELSKFHYPCHINNCVKCKYLNRFSGKLECHNEIAPPPQSWCYVENLD